MERARNSKNPLMLNIMMTEKHTSVMETSRTAAAQEVIEGEINSLMASLPDPAQLSPEEIRGIIARYGRSWRATLFTG